MDNDETLPKESIMRNFILGLILAFIVSYLITVLSRIYDRKSEVLVQKTLTNLERDEAWKNGYEAGKFTGVTFTAEEKTEFLKWYAINKTQ